ncbi:zinc ribbon domain-containing protein [Lactobacillus sp. LC28-10]|uniref:Zinc ribbon domain-containing protein n=1 Tax=Secundilactobacillus angelensis TaxID=2722706 RepID=A0ABX1L0Q0_9LACO|nr:zinc ribbon domain-containing protein [Secundilactobacillus angelensis]NLR19100.1 zinc ribbon domain-containing protein [Secundilactobacillus angelensis]
MENRYCTNCGKELPRDAEFCLYCGTKQPTVERDAPRGDNQYNQSDNHKSNDNQDNELGNTFTTATSSAGALTKQKINSPKKSKHKNKRIWFVLAAVVVIFIGLAIHASTSSSSATGTSASYDNSSSDNSSSDDTDDSDNYDDTDDSDTDDSEDTGDFENEAVAGISSSDYDATEAAENTYSYGELLKSDDYNGESYNITNAQVLQASEDDGATTLLVYTDEYADDIFKVYYPDTTDAVEDDYVTIKGVLGSREDYDTQSGGSNTVPTIVAQDVSVTGQGS